jgi:hypothetical protein
MPMQRARGQGLMSTTRRAQWCLTSLTVLPRGQYVGHSMTVRGGSAQGVAGKGGQLAAWRGGTQPSMVTEYGDAWTEAGHGATTDMACGHGGGRATAWRAGEEHGEGREGVQKLTCQLGFWAVNVSPP